MKDIRLYIADALVDLDSESIITMNYTLDDTDNPTIVKNSFSKSITLPSTERNNALFGGIYDLTRVTVLAEGKYSGVNFSTLKRTPFQLYVNDDLVESGYIQLTAITKTNGVPRYTIQAYGGLGDFLYNLMYNEQGDKRTLASLAFGFDGYTGDPANEMDFSITREVVATAWSNLPRAGRKVFAEALTFIPAYNGVNSDFDAEKALINYNGSGAMGLPSEIDDGNGNKYSRINGYGLVEFNRALDETETRDMRSYLQRPALSVMSLIEACADPANNGGYTVNLDPSFFNEDNPLYYDAYITLPMLSNDVENKDATFPMAGGEDFVGDAADRFVRETSVGRFSLTGIADNAEVTINVPLSLRVKNNTDTTQYDELFTDLAYYVPTDREAIDGIVNVGEYRILEKYRSAMVAQIIVRDSKTGKELAVSSEMALSYDGDFKRNWVVYSPYDSTNRGIVNVKGHFKRNGSVMEFRSVDNNNTFPISLSFIKGPNTAISVYLRFQRAYAKNYANISNNASLLWKNHAYYKDPEFGTLDDRKVTRNLLISNYTDSEAVVSTSNLPSISSGSKITKELLLGDTESPADYLLSYIKLFNLRLIKDKATKTIDITHHFFNGSTINISDRIDSAQTMTITPNVFSKKFLRMGLKQSETYFSKKYKDSNKLEYAQKRVDTGFSFNTDTEEIYKDNVFTSAVPCLAVSKFYYTFKNSSGGIVLAPFADDVKLTLAQGDDISGYKTLSKDIASASIIDPAKTSAFSNNKGYDIMPRMCYYDEKNGEREAVDIVNNLVVFCGRVKLNDTGGNAINYWLTDDVPEMMKLSDKPCYLLTYSARNMSGDDIATNYTQLPSFLSIQLLNGKVTNSFDFAKSKESYIPNIDYPEGTTLYEKYWAALYADRIDVDTRKVVCMVNLSGIKVDGELLRSFFFFDGNYWLLNKVVDYDPTTERLTKCEFIKVKNVNAYIYATADEE